MFFRSEGTLGFSPGFQPGFNPGNPPNKRFALKGREMRVPGEARTHCRAKVRVRNWEVRPSDPASALLGHSIWRPFRARPALGGRFPGLKPWAESL
jgi:hypothetical protein